MTFLTHSNAASSQAAEAGEAVPPPSVSPATIPHDERGGCFPVVLLTAAFWIGVYLAWSFIW